MSESRSVSEETITVTQYKRRLYDLALEIGNIAHIAYNDGDVTEKLDEIGDRLLEESK